MYTTFLTWYWALVNMQRKAVPFLLLTTSAMRMTHLLELGRTDFHSPHHMNKDKTGFQW